LKGNNFLFFPFFRYLAVRAGDWLFSHMDDLEQAVSEALGKGSSGSASSSTTAGGNAGADDGEGKYTLFAIISHIGKNTDHGHYVCHVRKNSGRWVLFNDEKVSQFFLLFSLLICVFRLPILRSLH
jgi:uncharacterized UBP type Zn finger protein